ncbi:MAG TPA: hypothetical protein DCY55_07775 [Gammaproteobacteria bacterium]|nr:hypothetical protein [Gammaproteobacteria bacterium]
MYDEQTRTTYEMEVVEFRFINPHPFITAQIVDRSIEQASEATPDLWTLEMDNRWELVDLGFTNSTFKSGDKILVTANPSPYDDRALYVRALEHPVDGYRYEHNVRHLFKLQ